MFDAIVRFSVRKKLFVALTTLFLLLGGIYSMLTLPIDANREQDVSFDTLLLLSSNEGLVRNVTAALKDPRVACYVDPNLEEAQAVLKR